MRVRAKSDTTRGFRPAYAVEPFHLERVQSITRLDGELARFDVHPEWLSFLRRDAYVANAQASASIEGNPLSLEEAQAAVERFEARRVARPAPDEREIVQHYRYFRSLEDRTRGAVPDLTLDEIARVHRELLDGVLPREKRVGEIRGPRNAARVFVGTLEGTPPGRVRAEIQALIAWYYGEGARVPLPIRAAIWFHEFEAIHPFRDGNGRAGRALTHRLLATDGLPNSLLVALDRPFNEDRTEYYRALATVPSGGRYEAWVGYFLASLQDAYRASLGVVGRLSRIPENLTGAQRAIVEYLLRSGATEVRVAALARALGYRPITITVALIALANDHGLLAHNGRRGRASAYHPSPALRALLAGRRTTARPRGS